jgi:hypothetical protein
MRPDADGGFPFAGQGILMYIYYSVDTSRALCDVRIIPAWVRGGQQGRYDAVKRDTVADARPFVGVYVGDVSVAVRTYRHPLPTAGSQADILNNPFKAYRFFNYTLGGKPLFRPHKARE